MKRYSFYETQSGNYLEPHPDGDWVRAEDAEAEVAAWKATAEESHAAGVELRRFRREADATIASLRAELEAYRIAENRP